MDIFDGLNSSSSDDDGFNFNERDSIDGFFRPPKEKNGSGFLEHRTFSEFTFRSIIFQSLLVKLRAYL